MSLPNEPPVQVVEHASGQALLDHAGAFLQADEAENNLPLGLAGRFRRAEDTARDEVYLATLETGGEVVGVALRTPPYNLILTRMPESALSALVERLQERGEVVPGAVGVPEIAEAFADRWMAVTGAAVRDRTPERIYQMTEVRAPGDVPGALCPARPDDVDLVVDWTRRFAAEAEGEHPPEDFIRRRIEARIQDGEIFAWEDGRVVSIASASGRTPNGIRIGLVYTPPELRRRGYASACVAALSQRMLDSGRRFCFLYTDLGNPTSNHIYQAIGYRPVCDVSLIRFQSGA